MSSIFMYGAEIDPDVMRREYVDFTSRVPARLEGFRLCFNVPDVTAPGAGCANIIGDPKDTVQGALYEIDPELLERLDRLHGVSDGRYVRVVVTVTTSEGETVRAETFVGDIRVYQDACQPELEVIERMTAQTDVLDSAYRDRLRTYATVQA